ncbi:MAG TPA: hypothetical protein VK662_05255, partial [Acidothermaceae bacterium]|nr:hypothetical protein [Acidothermaceae bacterium]
MSGLTEIEPGSRAAFRRRVGGGDESDADTVAIYDAKVMDEGGRRALPPLCGNLGHPGPAGPAGPVHRSVIARPDSF